MDKIPPSFEERTALRRQIADFVSRRQLTPPVALHTLHALAEEFASANALTDVHDWLVVEIHNAVWLPRVAAIPHDRRLLLLPKCLSKNGECRGEMDEFGLLCHRCGRCTIPSLQERADAMGVLSMVAEGFASVIELIEQQVVDAVIGVSCLDSLEKAFPLLVRHAVPGLAIPLNHSGCIDTDVDVEYVMSLMAESQKEDIPIINYKNAREEVNLWFAPERLAQFWSPAPDSCSQIAFDWLTADGKRWRPFLLAAVYQALSGSQTLGDEVRRAALAVESFHKASLVHDDIQDRELQRYGRPTVFAAHGDAIAINVGDLLIGEGYRLLSACANPALTAAIAEAHLSLCRGQGMELAWASSPTPLTLGFVLEIFSLKTVPAFEVALQLGRICAGCHSAVVTDALAAYSKAMGIAYQLNDDLEDATQDSASAPKPSAVLALQSEHPDWNIQEVEAEIRRLVEHYRRAALDALSAVENFELRRLLFHITEKILRCQ